MLIVIGELFEIIQVLLMALEYLIVLWQLLCKFVCILESLWVRLWVVYCNFLFFVIGGFDQRLFLLFFFISDKPYKVVCCRLLLILFSVLDDPALVPANHSINSGNFYDRVKFVGVELRRLNSSHFKVLHVYKAKWNKKDCNSFIFKFSH